MKKLFFFCSIFTSIAASATVTVTPISTDYAAQKVTFRVAWTGSAYNNRVWVWIDLCPVSGVTPSTFQTAVISAASATSGNVIYASTNTRGFFVTTNPSTVTATLSNVSGKFNWCAYGSDYPPNVTLDKGTYTFKGSPFFMINSPAQTVTSKTIAKASLAVASQSTFTDATGYPGIGSLYCPYTGSDLYMDAAHLCQQRASGAKNWEAWIKDTRDNHIYRIVQFSNGHWWFAEDLAIADKRYAVCYGVNIYDGSNKPNCPTGWQIPTNTVIRTSQVNNANYGGLIEMKQGYVDQYGNCVDWNRNDVISSDCTLALFYYDFDSTWHWNCCDAACTSGGSCNCTGWTKGRIRCFRQL
jgi:hypothetical protein